MSFDHPWLLAAAGFLVALCLWAGRRYLSSEAKLERRRRRNNARLQPKVNRPMVRLSVRTRRKKTRS